MTNMKELYKKESNELFNPEQYANFETAWQVLTKLANDRSMPEKQKHAFNRNFYGYVAKLQHIFDVDILRPVKHGVEYLISLSPDDREKMYLEGDFWGRTWKLLDDNAPYGSCWRAESGTAKFPSQYMHLCKIVFLNDLHKKVYKGANNVSR